MPRKNGNNTKTNREQQKSAMPLNHAERMKKYRAVRDKKKQTLRVANSGKFEHLRKFVASYKQNETAYNKIMNRKLAQEMAQQNHEPKPETEIKNENNVAIEEPKVAEELKVAEAPQKPTDEVAKENEAETVSFEDIKVDDSELDDPALDEELAQLEQKMKKEEELKAMGIDPESSEELDDPELEKELKELMQKPEEKLEGAALEEAFQSLSNEVEGETKAFDADVAEFEDPDVDEDINRIEREIKKEEEETKPEAIKLAEEEPKPTEQSEPTEEEQLIATEKPPVIPRDPMKPESIFAKNPAHRTIVPEKKSLDAKYDLRYNFKEAKLKKIFFKEGELSRGNMIGEAYEENDLIEAEYEIEKIEHKINENDTVVSHRVSIPDFDDLLAQRRGDQEATSQAVHMLSEILHEAGITNQQNEFSLAEAVYQKLSGTMENHPSLSGKDSVMHDVAVAFFDESYNALGYSGLNTVDRIVTAQKIANVMMQGYSPLGFVYGELDQYTDNYVITNSNLLERRLMENAQFSEAESEALVEGVVSRLDDDSERLQAEFEARYGGESLSAEDELRIYAPNFHKQYDERIDDELFAENVKKQIGDVLRSSGMTGKEDRGGDEEIDVDQEIKNTVDAIYEDTVQNIRLMYGYNSVGSTVSYMTNWNYETTLKALNGGTMLPRNPIVTAQRISDLILKSYTPIAFAEKGALNRYANSYVIKNKDNLKERLIGVGTYSEKEIEDILQRDLLAELRQELKGGVQVSQPKPQPQEQQPQELQDNGQENKPEEITEIKAEDRNEPTLAEDFEFMHNNSNEPAHEEIKIYEDPIVIDENKLEENRDSAFENEQKESNGPLQFASLSELYATLYRERVTNTYLNLSVETQMTDILREVGSNLLNDPGFVQFLQSNMSHCMLVHFPEENGEPSTMDEVAVQFFAKAHELLREDALSPKDRIIASQKIADLALKNYSSLTYATDEISNLYTQDFVIKNVAMLKDALEAKGIEKEAIQAIEAVANERDELSNNEQEIEMFSFDESDPLSYESAYQKDVVIDEPQPEPLYSVSELIEMRIGDPDIYGEVNSQLNDILKSAGSVLADKPRYVGVIHDVMSRTMLSSFDPNQENVDMPDVATAFFKNAYDGIHGEDWSLKDKAINAQKIADLMLKNYSPIPIIGGEIQQFADNYVLKNKEMYRTLLPIAENEIDSLFEEVQKELAGVSENNEQEIEKNEQEIKPEEITEIKEERQNEPTLADDFEPMRNNSNESEPEEIKIVEDELVTDVLGKNDQEIENNEQEIEKNEQEIEQSEPTEEEREKQLVKNAKERLQQLQSQHGGTIEDRQDRLNLIKYYQDIVDSHMSFEEFAERSNKLAEKARREAAEREERERRLKEQENAAREVEQAEQEIEQAEQEIDPNAMTDEKEQPEPVKEEPQPQPQPINALDDDDFIDGTKEDAFERKLAEQQRNLQNDQAPVNEEVQLQPQPQPINAFDDDDFIDGTKEDAFERKLAEQQQNALKAEEDSKKKAAQEKKNQLDESAKATFFTNRLNTFNSMYQTNVNANDFVSAVSEAWTFMKNGDAQAKANGQKIMGDLFKNVLQSSFEVEKNASYNEHRIPEFNEIIKSTNELFRSAMFAFTDLYHDPKSASLFDATAYGGLNAKELAELTVGDSHWKMDQKSDEAWEVQSRDAKNLAEQWLKADKPYEKMINEMNSLIESAKGGTLGLQETYAKLIAAEWLLINNEKMMVENPEDPLNPIPNWGNRYWKTLTAAREAAGISKHTSMRELVQGDYAEMAKAVVNKHYNERQINDYVLDPDARAVEDSLEAQKEEFTTQSRDVIIKEPPKSKNGDKVMETDENYIRRREPVPSEDERVKMSNEPKVFSNMVIDKQADLQIDAAREGSR